VEGTVIASSSTPFPIPDTDATTASVPNERPNRLARRSPRATVIGSLARFAQDAWNEPVVRVAASAALLALGERLVDRLGGAEHGRRATTREQTQPASRYEHQATTQNTSGDRSLVPYTHPGELADRGYVGSVIETIIIIRRTLRRR
jgi:hypothetical protein